MKRKRNRLVSLRFNDDEFEQIDSMRKRLGFKNNVQMARKILLTHASDSQLDFLCDPGFSLSPNIDDIKIELALNEYTRILYDMLCKQGLIK